MRIFYFAILTIYFSHFSNAQQASYIPKYYALVVPTNGNFKQCSREVPEKMKSFWAVEDSDVIILHENLKKITTLKAELCCQTNGIIQSLDKYVFQYFGVTINRKRFIYINAFPISDLKDKEIKARWKSSIVSVCDGGDYFWGVLFNLETKEFEQLAINGRS